MDMLGLILAGVIIYEGCWQLSEHRERKQVYDHARAVADANEASLLVIGCPKWGLWHGHGDYTLDLIHDPRWCVCPNPITGDIRDVDKMFMWKSVVVFSSHVLEHLTPSEGQEALNALSKIELAAYHVWPNKKTISGWVSPWHKSWPSVDNDGDIIFEARSRQ